MAIAFVQSVGAASSAGALSLGATITPTSGNNLIAAVKARNLGTTVSGPTGWTEAVHVAVDNTDVSIWYLENFSGSGSQTYTWSYTGTADSIEVIVAEFSGLAHSSSLDQTATNTNGTASTTVSSGTTATTASANELWFAALSYDGSATRTWSAFTSGFTQDKTEDGVGGHNTHLTDAYDIVSSTGAAACSATISGAQINSGVIATFKAASGTAINHDITARGRVSAVANHDVVMLGLISAKGFHDIVVLGNVGNTAFKGITFRGVVKGIAYHELNMRARVSALASHDVVVLGRVGTPSFRDVVVLGRVGTPSFRDVTTRARLSGTANHDLVIRGNIVARNTQGGVTLWANGTGTASFDHFRATQYPDPALSLAPALPRLGNTTVAWDETIPTNGSRTIKTSLDGVNWTDVSSSNGGSIPGLTGQPDPTIDYFNTNTSANYTNTSKSGGSAATVTYDTANSRVTLSGGSGGLYLYTALSDNDVDLIADMDESDAGGLVWRYVDTNNYYELGAYDDSSSGGFTNQLRLYKVVSGTRSLIGSASPITWPRSTPGSSPYKRLRVTMLGTTITVYFDGAVMQTATDSAFASGKMGMRNDGGTSRYYQLRLQPIGAYVSGTPAGDIVTGDFVYTQVTLSTTDPTVNPQILDLTTTANSPSVANGATISQLHDPTRPFAAFYNNEMDSLTQSSGDFYWALNSNALTFANRQAVPSPWILHSSDLLFTPNVKPTFSADLYRNRQTLTNCLGTVAVTGEQKIADGTATSWQMAYPLYSAPTITVQGIAKTVGVQGVDTGKDFYWQAASNSISQDASATAVPKGDVISVTYVGQFFTNVTRDNLAEQAARKAVEGGTGIVEMLEDGKQMLVSAAQTYADGLLARFSNNNTVEIQATTRRSGLQKGQALPTFLPEHSINNAQLLITKIVTIGEQLADGTILYQFQITATNGPNLNRWATALGL